MVERKTVKLPNDNYEKHNKRRKALGISWPEYIDGQTRPLEEVLRKVVREELDRKLGSNDSEAPERPEDDE